MSDEAHDAQCLHCRVTQVIEQYLREQVASGAEVNLPPITDKIVESLAQFIREAVPPDERFRMTAYALQHLGRALFEYDAADEKTQIN
jgi:hypothetical protein